MSSIAVCCAQCLKEQLEVLDQFLSSMIVFIFDQHLFTQKFDQHLFTQIDQHLFTQIRGRKTVHTNSWCRTGEEFRELFSKTAIQI